MLNNPKTLTPTPPKQALLIMKVVWAVMFVSAILYGILANYIAQNSVVQAPLPAFEDVKNLFYFMGVASLAMAKFFPPFLRSTALTKTKARLNGEALDQGAIMRAEFIPFISRLFFLEACVICGLILSFLSRDMAHYYYLAAPGMIGMLLSFPKMLPGGPNGGPPRA